VSSSFPPPGDDELHGFLDGEIEPERRSAIETFLKTSPVHAERVEGWRRQQQIIRAAFAPIEAEPAPASVLLPPPSTRRACLHLLRPCAEPSSLHLRTPAQGLPFWRKGAAAAVKLWRACARPLTLFAIFAAGAIVALVGAYFADRLHAPPVGAAIRTSAAASADHILAARTVAALMAFKPQQRAAASGAPPEKGRPASNQASLIVPNLSGVGFTLVGMRAAPARSGAPDDQMFCLFYAKATEPAVALCIARDEDGGAPGRFNIEEKGPSNGPEGAISWRQANAIYTLAGPLGEVELRSLAHSISAEIEAFD
jgi:anti-sigma factor RsiW